MTDDLEDTIATSQASLDAQLGLKAARKLRARASDGHEVWLGFGMMGLVGWSIVVPTLVGAGIGLWLDGHYPGRHPWTLALLMAGLCLGCFNAWRWVSQQNAAISQDADKPE
jgi:ATP synthase protein I